MALVFLKEEQKYMYVLHFVFRRSSEIALES